MSELKQIIQHQYGLTEVDLEIIREGPDNIVYEVKCTEGKYVLRLSKRDMGDSIKFEVDVLNQLGEEGLPVPETVATNNGERIGNYEGSKLVLYKFIQGEKYNLSDKDLSLAMVEDAGRTLSRLHAAARKIHPKYHKARNIYTEFERVLRNKDNFIKRFIGAEKIIEEVEGLIEWSKSNKESMLIHNDFRIGNLFFKDSKVSAILDFDWSCIGPAKKDLALALVEWSYPDGAKEHNQERLRAFLYGYNQSGQDKISLDSEMQNWMKLAALSEACTYVADVLEGIPKTETAVELKSYMYQKYIYFLKQNQL